jgi:hypothetical protein
MARKRAPSFMELKILPRKPCKSYALYDRPRADDYQRAWEERQK